MMKFTLHTIFMSCLVIICIQTHMLIGPDDILIRYANHPKVRAFLDTIAHAEGTSQADGYSMIFGHVKFEGFNDHPRMVVCMPYKETEQLCSSAAGRYQFLTRTWDSLAHRIRAHDFGPRNQDRAAVQVLIDKQALDDIYRGRFGPAIKKLNTMWSSLPGSPYGQPTIAGSELFEVFKERCAYYGSQNGS